MLPDLSYRAGQGSSSYYALTAVSRYRTGRALLQLSYTWGHTIDNQSDPLLGDFFDLSFTRVRPPPAVQAAALRLPANSTAVLTAATRTLTSAITWSSTQSGTCPVFPAPASRLRFFVIGNLLRSRRFARVFPTRRLPHRGLSEEAGRSSTSAPISPIPAARKPAAAQQFLEGCVC